MKTNIRKLLIIGASVFLLAGCRTTYHVTRWEYRVVPPPSHVGLTQAEIQKNDEAFMNDLGKDGWIFVSQLDQALCFKRPVK